MSLVDPRVTKQAEILVDTSVRVQKGDKVVIAADILARALVLEVYRLCIKRGAVEVKIHFDSYEFTEVYFQNASRAQLEHFPELAFDEIKKIDCYIGIRSSANTRGLTGIDPKIVSARHKVVSPVNEWRVEKTRWVVTNFPTEALAQEADMSLTNYENFVFSAVAGVDWKKTHRDQEKIRRLLDRTKMVRIVAPGTDLSVRIEGRHAVNAAGECNMPDGEIFTSVVENSAEGHIEYSYPALYMGREFHNVALDFKKGKVVKATATKGEEELNQILEMDRGSRFIGELGIGNNYKITRFSKDILFDEKIGGSIHIALGRGYKENGSRNISALHWDMIKDLRDGGELWFDGKLVQRNGKWLLK